MVNGATGIVNLPKCYNLLNFNWLNFRFQNVDITPINRLINGSLGL